MKPYSFLVIAVFTTLTANCQLSIQSGATLILETGSHLAVEGSFSNAGGTCTNKGKLEVQGNFINNGSYSSPTNNDTLLLSGTDEAGLFAGSSSFQYLEVNKTGGAGVVLTGNALVNARFELLAGRFSTDTSNGYEFIAPVTATFSFAAGTEISGNVKRTGWANGSAVVFNNPNMVIKTNGGTAPATMLVKMVTKGNPTGGEREVKRAFSFTPTGGNDYSADVTFPYDTSEVNTNKELNLAPWYYHSAEWNAKLAGNAVNTTSHFVSATGIPAAALANTEWKLADPNYTFNVSAFLRGSWNGSGMTTTLNSAGLLPLTQPYTTAPFNYAGTESVVSIPNANIVDWVLVELRKPSSGFASDATSSTVIGRKAAFLLKNGVIVDLDGVTPVSFNINKQGPAFVVVRHRNHLAAMSYAIPSNAAGTFMNDFSVLGNVYKNPAASSDPEMFLPSGTVYGLWAGDANNTNSVNSLDVSRVKTAVANLLSGYQLQDVNLNGSINSLDVNISKAAISNLGSSSAVNRSGRSGQANSISTHVPD